MPKAQPLAKTKAKSKTKSSKLKLVVDNPLSQASLKKIQLRKINQKARQKVFRELVASTLNNPNHPYYALVNAQTRQAMIDSIAEHLAVSHYLNPTDS